MAAVLQPAALQLHPRLRINRILVDQRSSSEVPLARGYGQHQRAVWPSVVPALVLTLARAAVRPAVRPAVLTRMVNQSLRHILKQRIPPPAKAKLASRCRSQRTDP